MELKAKFGKYKAKDVQMYLAEQKKMDSEKSQAYIQRISLLEEEVQRLNKVIDEYKAKESVIAKVMLDATQHAKEIEDDCHKRADKSDEACRRLHNEWVTGMQSASANLTKMHEEVKKILDAIDGEFNTLCSWAGARLESLEKTSLPLSHNESNTLECEIAGGAGASLDDLCREMGFSGEVERDETEENNTPNGFGDNGGIPYGFRNIITGGDAENTQDGGECENTQSRVYESNESNDGGDNPESGLNE